MNGADIPALRKKIKEHASQFAGAAGGASARAADGVVAAAVSEGM